MSREEGQVTGSGEFARRAAVTAPLFLVAVIAIPQAFMLGIGTIDRPQPGLYPLLLSVLLIAVLIPVALFAFAEGTEPFEPRSVRVLGGVATVALFIVLWPITGLIIASSISLFIWMWRLGNERIVSSIITAVVTGAVCAYVFGSLLGVPLPMGMIGIP